MKCEPTVFYSQSVGSAIPVKVRMKISAHTCEDIATAHPPADGNVGTRLYSTLEE